MIIYGLKSSEQVKNVCKTVQINNQFYLINNLFALNIKFEVMLT